MASVASNGPPPTVSTVLLPELLGFSPQLLLDDIINTANDAITTTVNGMEDFLLRWAEARAKHLQLGDEWDSTQEVEQGLVAFQTLLESHTDIAFDFLEVWSLRNIFAFPPDLPIVAPHHEGLDLTVTAEEEQEIMMEIEELRRKIDNQRRLKRLYTRAVRRSSLYLRRSRERLSRLSFIDPSSLGDLSAVPSNLTTLLSSTTTLPPLDPTQVPVPPVRDPGKREWETDKTGYLNWATGVLMKRAGAGVGDRDVVDKLEAIGKPEDVKEFLETEGIVVEPERKRREGDDAMEVE